MKIYSARRLLSLAFLLGGACAPPAKCPQSTETCGAGAESPTLREERSCDESATEQVADDNDAGEAVAADQAATSELAGVSADGRFALYIWRDGFSAAQPLPPSSVFLHDLKTKTVKELSDGSHRDVHSAALDASGLFAVVQSTRWREEGADSQRPQDVVVFDLAANQHERVTLEAFQPRELLDLRMSDRGRQLFFLVDGQGDAISPTRALYRFEVATASITPIEAKSLNSSPLISADGKTGAFLSAQGMVGHHGPNYELAWFRDDRVTGLNPSPPFMGSAFALSQDGRFLAYDSGREEGEDSLDTSVVLELNTGKVQEVCALPRGAARRGNACRLKALSGNGRFVVLSEASSALGEEQTGPLFPTLVLVDRQTKKRTKLGNEDSFWHEVHVSNDGEQIVYERHGEAQVVATRFDVASKSGTALTHPKEKPSKK